MHKTLIKSLGGVCTALFVLCQAAMAAPAVLKIDVAKRGHEIPKNFYGLMTEEINYSYDGGLYAELVRNRSFQDAPHSHTGRDPRPPLGGLPVHWSVWGEAKAGTNNIDPVNTALPVNLRLTLSGARGGIANDGYWGIPVKPETNYTASFYARACEGFTGKVQVSLVADADNKELVTAESEALSGSWKKYTITFKTPATVETTAKARFLLSAKGQGAIDFSLVSLFPPTYQGATNGLRPDLMKLMADMKPAFIRLPGGNYVEGNRFADRFAWKKMIGPVEQRPGHDGCWSYRSSDGFGLPEYLLWCKQLGAEPVLALFAGYTLNGDYVPAGSPEMELYTKEALEEIEYVMGPADSEWGRRRAADGFPEPFALKYVEIGNEDFFDRSGSYEGRFAQMAKAIREKYPQLKIIATMPVKSFKPDMVDDHLYASASSMIRQGTRYDVGSDHPEGRKADGTKIFMGEWATQGGSPTPNHLSALADAVFVMGLERNSDAVIMQCYAPLLTNVNPGDPAKGMPRGWQWATNLIGYDALGAFGSPSYHVLALFGQNRGDVLLDSSLEVAAPKTTQEPPAQGRVGVGMYGTQVEYTDLVVRSKEGKQLSSANLVNEAGSWVFPKGKWISENGVLRSPENAPQTWALAGDPSWSSYTVTMRARKLGGAEGFILLWHSADGDNYRWWNLGGWGNTVSRCEVSENGGREPYGPSTPFTVEKGRWYELRLEVDGHQARGFVDGKLVMEASDRQYKPLPAAYASASYLDATGELVIKIVNTQAEPLDLQLQLAGVTTLSAGSITTLVGAPGDVNSIKEPEKIAPRREALQVSSPSFARKIPGYSVSILRFPAKP